MTTFLFKVVSGSMEDLIVIRSSIESLDGFDLSELYRVQRENSVLNRTLHQHSHADIQQLNRDIRNNFTHSTLNSFQHHCDTLAAKVLRLLVSHLPRLEPVQNSESREYVDQCVLLSVLKEVASVVSYVTVRGYYVSNSDVPIEESVATRFTTGNAMERLKAMSVTYPILGDLKDQVLSDSRVTPVLTAHPCDPFSREGRNCIGEISRLCLDDLYPLEAYPKGQDPRPHSHSSDKFSGQLITQLKSLIALVSDNKLAISVDSSVPNLDKHNRILSLLGSVLQGFNNADSVLARPKDSHVYGWGFDADGAPFNESHFRQFSLECQIASLQHEMLQALRSLESRIDTFVTQVSLPESSPILGLYKDVEALRVELERVTDPKPLQSNEGNLVTDYLKLAKQKELPKESDWESFKARLDVYFSKINDVYSKVLIQVEPDLEPAHAAAKIWSRFQTQIRELQGHFQPFSHTGQQFRQEGAAFQAILGAIVGKALPDDQKYRLVKDLMTVSSDKERIQLLTGAGATFNSGETVADFFMRIGQTCFTNSDGSLSVCEQMCTFFSHLAAGHYPKGLVKQFIVSQVEGSQLADAMVVAQLLGLRSQDVIPLAEDGPSLDALPGMVKALVHSCDLPAIQTACIDVFQAHLTQSTETDERKKFLDAFAAMAQTLSDRLPVKRLLEGCSDNAKMMGIAGAQSALSTMLDSLQGFLFTDILEPIFAGIKGSSKVGDQLMQQHRQLFQVLASPFYAFIGVGTSELRSLGNLESKFNPLGLAELFYTVLPPAFAKELWYTHQGGANQYMLDDRISNSLSKTISAALVHRLLNVVEGNHVDPGRKTCLQIGATQRTHYETFRTGDWLSGEDTQTRFTLAMNRLLALDVMGTFKGSARPSSRSPVVSAESRIPEALSHLKPQPSSVQAAKAVSVGGRSIPDTTIENNRAIGASRSQHFAGVLLGVLVGMELPDVSVAGPLLDEAQGSVQFKKLVSAVADAVQGFDFAHLQRVIADVPEGDAHAQLKADMQVIVDQLSTQVGRLVETLCTYPGYSHVTLGAPTPETGHRQHFYHLVQLAAKDPAAVLKDFFHVPEASYAGKKQTEARDMAFEQIVKLFTPLLAPRP